MYTLIVVIMIMFSNGTESLEFGKMRFHDKFMSAEDCQAKGAEDAPKISKIFSDQFAKTDAPVTVSGIKVVCEMEGDPA